MKNTKGLDVFQELYLGQKDGMVADIRAAISNHVLPPWRQDFDAECLLKARDTDGRDVLAFEREASDGLNAVRLVLFSRTDGYSLANIVPTKDGFLSHTQYNAILQDFVARIAKAAASQAGFLLDVSRPTLSIDDWLSPVTVSSLLRFSAAANKSTGASHPLDQQRWLQFIIDAHQDEKRLLEAGSLSRWLIEIELWPEEIARDLASQYDFALDLLTKYDQSRR